MRHPAAVVAHTLSLSLSLSHTHTHTQGSTVNMNINQKLYDRPFASINPDYVRLGTVLFFGECCVVM